LVPSAKKAGSQTCQTHSVFIANVVMQAKWDAPNLAIHQI